MGGAQRRGSGAPEGPRSSQPAGANTHPAHLLSVPARCSCAARSGGLALRLRRRGWSSNQAPPPGQREATPLERGPGARAGLQSADPHSLVPALFSTSCLSTDLPLPLPNHLSTPFRRFLGGRLPKLSQQVIFLGLVLQNLSPLISYSQQGHRSLLWALAAAGYRLGLRVRGSRPVRPPLRRGGRVGCVLSAAVRWKLVSERVQAC